MLLRRGVALVAVLGACLDPTEITIVVQTNFACSDFGAARVRVGTTTTDTTTCMSGDGGGVATIGTLVVVPGTSLDTPVPITVIGAVREGGQSAPSLDTCEERPGNGGGCITTARSLYLSLHRSLTLPILIDTRCATVQCTGDTTCIAGDCEPIACGVTDSNLVSCAIPDAGPPDAGDAGLPSTFRVADIAARGDGTCIVLTTGELICWGQNDGSRFGDQGGLAVIGPSFVPAVSGVKRIALGASFACALTTNGAAECWGTGSVGQLGDGTTTSRSTPAPIADPATFVQIIAGSAHACGLTNYPDAKLHCWGANDSAQLGSGPSGFVSTPTIVPGGLTFIAASAGNIHTCAVGNANNATTTDSTYCWGSSLGAFGSPSGVTAAPTAVAGITLPDTAICGEFFTLADTSNGPTGTYAWGDNTYGQTDPTQPGSGPLAPAIVEPYGIPLAAGGAVACKVANGSATVACWGDSSAGELGPNASGSGPAQLTLDAKVGLIAAGSKHVCAVTQMPTTDEVWCWGDGVANPTRVLP